nr:hypothetical protein [Rhodococcus opacus]
MKSSTDGRRHQRRHAAAGGVDHKRKHRDKETEILIGFASMWAPYGGASEDEILVQFGLSRLQFIDRLWEKIPESNCALEEIQRLAHAYPRRPRTNGFKSR